MQGGLKFGGCLARKTVPISCNIPPARADNEGVVGADSSNGTKPMLDTDPSGRIGRRQDGIWTPVPTVSRQGLKIHGWISSERPEFGDCGSGEKNTGTTLRHHGKGELESMAWGGDAGRAQPAGPVSGGIARDAF